MRKWLKRIGLGMLGLLLVAVAAGATIEQWARYRAPSEFPALGRMVDIGGRRLQIDCRGNGSPTVILESGGDASGATDWDKVQSEIARTTRVCSYSRAGIMWSDPASGKRDGMAVIADLHSLLEDAGERAPFVMVGWSIGGPYVVLYTQKYGADVAGLVFVDPSHPDWPREIEAITHRPPQNFSAAANIVLKFAWTGLLRPAQFLMPPPRGAFLPTSLGAVQIEAAFYDQTLAEVAAAHNLGNRPLIILTRGAPYTTGDLRGLGATKEQGQQLLQVWERLHDGMATWSSNGRNELLPNASHDIPEDDPQAIIGAVDEVVAAVRDGHH